MADPLLWLTKIHQHRSAVVGGPNFGLRHVLEALDGGPPVGVDLSCVRLWFNGAEPIWVPTMRAFVSRMAAAGLVPEDYYWYLDLRRYGSVPHAGFGLGFERLVVYVCGLANIRDAIAYPRAPGSAEF